MQSPLNLNPRARRLFWTGVLSAQFLGACAALPRNPATVPPPEPYGALPSARQMDWHGLETYAFVHFSINTFTDREWGQGDELPDRFAPTDFDADQIVASLAAGGMRAVILTAKHHDGFCLWPTQTTAHSVASSSWRAGQGDVVGDFAAACRRQGLRFGVYVSPWDRNNALYGRPEYVTEVLRPQIRELLTNYGEIFEFWFDGANGGDGYYGGARESRSIDRGSYYGWETTWQMIRDLSPNTVLWSDVGPDARWIGNEKGVAGDPCWATYTPRGVDGAESFGPGGCDYSESGSGTRDGRFWMPGECDVSIRPGWFWHADQDDEVRSPANLMDLYLQSVGRGASLLLNVPPDQRGQIHATDAANLAALGQHLKQTFARNLASGARLTASNVRGGDHAGYGPHKLLDTDPWSAWVSDDFVRQPELIIDLKEPTRFNLIRLREDIRLGQRVAAVSVDAWLDGAWQTIAEAQSIGAQRLWRVPAVKTSRLRLRVTRSPVCPALSDFGLFWEQDPPSQN
jgi:alpha-L-fucosidase